MRYFLWVTAVTCWISLRSLSSLTSSQILTTTSQLPLSFLTMNWLNNVDCFAIIITITTCCTLHRYSHITGSLSTWDTWTWTGDSKNNSFCFVYLQSVLNIFNLTLTLNIEHCLIRLLQSSSQSDQIQRKHNSQGNTSIAVLLQISQLNLHFVQALLQHKHTRYYW